MRSAFTSAGGLYVVGNIARRVWWLVPVAVVAAVSVTVYAYGAKDKRCAEDFESAALSVSSVITADFTCTTSFEGTLRDGRVTLDAGTEEDAVALMESVLRAYAEMDMSDATVAYVDYVSEDGTISVVPSDTGFNGTPSLSEIREHYGL